MRESGRFGPVPTIAELEAGLASAPPATKDIRARLKAIRSIDALFKSAAVPKKPDIVAFYRRRVEQGIKALEDGPPKGQVRVVKFYSSSTVIRSADGCFAFDFCEGPCSPVWKRPEDTTDKFRTFHLTPTQRERIAKLVDVYFVTHRHHDHVSYDLCERMAKLGKPVIIPPEGKKWFTRGKAPFAAKLQTPPGDAVHTAGKIRWVHYYGRQYMEWIDGDHERPVKDSPKTVDNNCYVVELSGLKFAHAGDNREEAHVEWIRKWNRKGWKPDVAFALGIGKFTKDVGRLWNGRRIPVHEYEFRHERFNRMTWWLGRKPLQSLKHRPVLFWGEHLDIPAPKKPVR
jgi:L-ascorbate metabolism protein UlaG (beta-lactamase superfamily)